MVFNFIDFLLGAKKAKKPQKGVQAASPLNNQPQGANSTKPQQEEQKQTPQETNSENVTPATNTLEQTQDDQVQFEDSQKQENTNTQQTSNVGSGTSQVQGVDSPMQKSKVVDALTKLKEEAQTSNEKVSSMISEIRDMQTTVNNIGNRVDELEESKKNTEAKLGEIDSSMTKFLSLYELVNNQFNPFVEGSNQQIEEPKRIVLDEQGNSIGGENPASPSGENENNSGDSNHSFDNLIEKSQHLGQAPNHISALGKGDVSSAILALDTLDIEEAAGEAVPLTHLKNNTNSLVTILSWLEYLVKKVGIEETRSTLRYYTEVLRWITPEVFFDLDKYLKGMRDKDHSEGDSLGVKDHIVSLYFISKLNEKALDEKLTNAVIQIIKQ